MTNRTTARKHHDDKSWKMMSGAVHSLAIFTVLGFASIPFGNEALTGIIMAALPIVFFGFIFTGFYHENKILNIRQAEMDERKAARSF